MSNSSTKEYTRNYYRKRYQDKHNSLKENRIDLSKLTDWSKKRTIIELEAVRSCITVKELAECLEVNLDTIYRWFHDEIFPKPNHHCYMESNRFGRDGESFKEQVYLLTEARSLVIIMKKHYSSYSYLRKSHTETIDKLFEAKI
jgi:hypothetical protein